MSKRPKAADSRRWRTEVPRAKTGKESGFALIAALMALWVLTAVGVLVFTMTTQDVRVSSRTVGEKRAFFATEAGVHRLTQVFNPENLGSAAVTEPVNSLEPSSQYTIAQPVIPTWGPAAIPLPGYSFAGGGQQLGVSRYLATVTGENTNYASKVQVAAGIGFGPVNFTSEKE